MLPQSRFYIFLLLITHGRVRALSAMAEAEDPLRKRAFILKVLIKSLGHTLEKTLLMSLVSMERIMRRRSQHNKWNRFLTLY